MNPDLPGASRKGASPSPPVGERATLPGRVSARPGLFQIPPEITRGENAAPESPVGSVGGVMQPRPTHWTPQKTLELIGFWYSGRTTGEIGKKMGVSKNAVVGRVHRLGLPKRNSPIHRKKPKIEPPKLLTLADIGPGQCRFPEGDPGDVGFHFCGEPVIKGKSYCQTHAERCYLNQGHVAGPFKLPNLTTLDK